MFKMKRRTGNTDQLTIVHHVHSELTLSWENTSQFMSEQSSYLSETASKPMQHGGTLTTTPTWLDSYSWLEHLFILEQQQADIPCTPYRRHRISSCCSDKAHVWLTPGTLKNLKDYCTTCQRQRYSTSILTCGNPRREFWYSQGWHHYACGRISSPQFQLVGGGRLQGWNETGPLLVGLYCLEQQKAMSGLLEEQASESNHISQMGKKACVHIQWTFHDIVLKKNGW